MMSKIYTLVIVMILSAIAISNIAAAETIKPYHQDVALNSGGQVNCSVCHEKDQQLAQPKTEKCLSCHGSYQEISDVTARPNNSPDYEPNPHDSVHYGQDIACTNCHKEHRISEIYCNYCHEFNYSEMKR
jgi:Cytochrome c3